MWVWDVVRGGLHKWLDSAVAAGEETTQVQLGGADVETPAQDNLSNRVEIITNWQQLLAAGTR